MAVFAFSRPLAADDGAGLPPGVFVPPVPADAGIEPPVKSTGTLESQIRGHVNKLNSTAESTQQTFARNQLEKLGSRAVPYRT